MTVVADAALGTGVEEKVIVHRSSFLVVLRGAGGDRGEEHCKKADSRNREIPM